MRKYTAILLAAIMLIALAGCSSGEEISWDGNYFNDNGYLAVTESSKKGFTFAFLMNDGKELRGVAEAKGETANYGDLDFTISGDTLVVTLADGATDTAGLAGFLGTYMVNNVGTMVDEGSPEEMGLPAQTDDGSAQPIQSAEQPAAVEEEGGEQPVADPQTEGEQPVAEPLPEGEQQVVDPQPVEEQQVVDPIPAEEQPVMEQEQTTV